MLSHLKYVLFWFTLMAAFEVGALDIDQNFQTENLSRHMYILPDTAGQFDILSFYANLADFDFKTTTLENYVENFGAEYYWLYIPINFTSNSDLEAFLEIINPDLNEIICYAYKNGSIYYESQLSGDNFPFTTRELAYKHFVFPIDFDHKFNQYEIILKINTAGEAFICPIKLSEKSHFYHRANHMNFGSGVYYCLLTLFIISLLIFYRVSKEKMILYYIGYLSTMMIYLMDIEGLTNQYLIGNITLLQGLKQPVLAGVIALFFLLFSNRFFNFKRENKSLFYLIRWTARILTVVLLLMPVIMSLPSHLKRIALFLYLLVLLISSVSIYLIVAFKAIQQRKARYYLFAITFGIEAVGFTIHFLATQGFIADMPFTRNILFYASIISLSFFSIYLIFLIDQINSNFKSLRLQLTEQKDQAFRNIMVGEDIERVRISKMLEEKIAQRLTSVKAELASILKKIRQPNKKKMLNDIDLDISLALENVFSVNLNVAPSFLDEKGLKYAIEKDIERVELSFPAIHFDCIVDEIDALGISAFDQSVIYRIFEESLNNAIKHSNASQIDVYLLAEDNDLIFKIQDDGIGIQDPQGAFMGIGMKNIESRVSYLNGHFKLQSHPGKGTSITVIIPSKTSLKKKIA